MAIRAINSPCPDFQKSESQWHKLECKLITPLYGGGIESSTIDEKMPIRGSEIRGQLRFWWRILAKNLWMKDKSNKDIQKAEFKLWGGGTSEQFASKVFVKVDFSEYRDNAKKEKNINLISHRSYYKEKNNDAIAYVLFPADKDGSNKPRDCDVLKEGFIWTLSIKFDVNLSEEYKQQVIQTIRWWSQFGGLGARSRRGTGAFIIENENTNDIFIDVSAEVTVNEVEQIGCEISKRGNDIDPIRSWRNSIVKYKEFRAIQKDFEKDFKRNNTLKIYPRAMFGMPIVLSKSETINYSDDAKRQRLASRLILRPFYNRKENKYESMALLLPYDDLLQKDNIVINEKIKVAMWDSKIANKLTPIKDNGGTNPLEAFMNYFQKG